MKQNIKAFIFDMDGVLVNTESILENDEFNLLTQLTNGLWTNSDQRGIRGMSLNDEYYLLKKQFKLGIPKDAFFQKYNRLLEKIYKERVSLIKESIDVLKVLYSKQYKLALASSTSHTFISIVLERFKLAKFFNVVASADDVNGKSKPDPDIFLYAASRLVVPPRSCVVVEDSTNGIKAAKSAGTTCIAFNEGNLRNDLAANLADYTVSSLKEILEIKQFFK